MKNYINTKTLKLSTSTNNLRIKLKLNWYICTFKMLKYNCFLHKNTKNQHTFWNQGLYIYIVRIFNPVKKWCTIRDAFLHQILTYSTYIQSIWMKTHFIKTNRKYILHSHQFLFHNDIFFQMLFWGTKKQLSLAKCRGLIYSVI